MGRASTAYLDERGRVIRAETPGLAATYFDYDERGRLYRTTEGSGALARISLVFFRADGLVDYVLDPLNRRTSYQYDAVGRLLKQTLPGGREISFSYDANGNVTSLTPPGKPAHGFTYNAGDLTTAYNPPDTGSGNVSTSFQYNLAKQPTLVTRPDGQTIGFEYDTRGRLLKLLIPDGTYTYAYHITTGNLSGIVAPDSDQMLFTYDGSLPLSMTWDGVIDGSVSVTYNNDFQVVTQSVSGLNTINFSYDNDGLLTTAGSLTLNWNLTNGMLMGTTLGNVTDSITPNIFGELERYQAFYSGNSIFDVQFGTRDKLGRITTKTETVNGETHTFQYIYDQDTDRLTDVYKDAALVSHYEYDENGNRLRYTGINGTFNGVYDAQDRLLVYGNYTCDYTANGELSKKIGPEGQTQYVYDVLGTLRLVILPDGKRIEYVIDAQNRRVGKKVNGVLTQGFLYQDSLAPVAELNGSGQIVSRFVYATGVNVPEYMVKSGITYRIITDHLGSPRLVINASTGAVAQRMEYDEFGNVLVDTNPGFQPFGFAGGLYDRDTRLVRFGARDYDPEVGRWTCKDPIGFEGGSANLFSYIANDPINNNDPLGLRTTIYILSGENWYGHAAININGTVYSYGRYNPQNVWGFKGSQGEGVLFRISENEFFNRDGRKAHVDAFELNLTSCEEQQIQKYLDNLYNNGRIDNIVGGRNIGHYDVFTNNCVTLIMRALPERYRIALGSQRVPSTFGATLFSLSISEQNLVSYKHIK
jgi:RHS repeat-associated protein